MGQTIGCCKAELDTSHYYGRSVQCLLTVNTFQGEQLNLDVDVQETIETLKMKLEMIKGWPA